MSRSQKLWLLASIILVAVYGYFSWDSAQKVRSSTTPPTSNALIEQVRDGVPECLFSEKFEHIIAGDRIRSAANRTQPFRELSALDRALWLREMSSTKEFLFRKAEPITIAYVGRITTPDDPAMIAPAFLVFFRTYDGKTCMYGMPLLTKPLAIKEMLKRYE